MTDFRRCSNSPLTLAPACSNPISKPRISTFFKMSGTSPSTILSASPSTTAVLPTPASPTKIGLFLRRRPRISMACRISRSRQNTGSISPARARAVKLTVYFSSAVPPPETPGAPACALFAAPSRASASSFEPPTISLKCRRKSSPLTADNSS